MRAAGGGNFGLLILSESTGTQRFYGYARTQTPQGVGFSTEGFPIENFNDQLQHATGLKRVAASAGLPAFQTNCFVATLGDAVNYELRLFNDTTGAQLGGTLSGTLTAFQQFRYLDVFAAAGVAAGDKTNVRAQFTNLTGADKKLIGFCTVQDNTTFSADFRIAKSFGGTPQNAFVQGGNKFGTTATLGTTDIQPLTLLMDNQPVMRYSPGGDGNVPSGSANIVAGGLINAINALGGAFAGQTIAGGGHDDVDCYEPTTETSTRSCGNGTANDLATVSGGDANFASGLGSTVAGGRSNSANGNFTAVGGGFANAANGASATVAGGVANIASGELSTVSGGQGNAASGSGSVVAGGSSNSASADLSFAAGHRAKATTTGSFIWADSREFDFQPSVSNFFGARATGGVGFTVAIDPTTGGVTQYCNLLPGVIGWDCHSERSIKENFVPIDGKQVLDRLVAMPLFTWNFKGADPGLRMLAPIAEDFYAAFGLGRSDKTVASGNVEGVALAAIQGLHQLMQEKDARINALERELRAQQHAAELQQMELAQLRQTVEMLLAKSGGGVTLAGAR